ncbi:MAG: hypothetical protein ACFCBW_11780 [Candidatus Competibacterales bacterium]
MRIISPIFTLLFVLGTGIAIPSAAQSPEATAVEQLVWQSIQDSREPEDFRAYLESFPNGAFVAEARERLAALGVPAPPAASPADPTPVPDTPTPDTPAEVDPAALPVAVLLERAAASLEAKRLLTPPEDSVRRWATAVLAREPDNAQARQLLSAAVERYLNWGSGNVNRGRLERAGVFANRARSLIEYATDDQRRRLSGLESSIRRARVEQEQRLTAEAARAEQATQPQERFFSPKETLMPPPRTDRNW